MLISAIWSCPLLQFFLERLRKFEVPRLNLKIDRSHIRSQSYKRNVAFKFLNFFTVLLARILSVQVTNWLGL